MPKPILFLLLFFMAGYPVIGQDITSIDELNAHSFELRSSNRDSSKNLAYKALASSKRLNYVSGVALAQLNLGIHYCNGDRLDSASIYLSAAYEYLLDSKDQHNFAISAWYKGKLYQKLGNFNRAFQYLQKAENLFRNQENYLFLIYVLTEQGVYNEMQDNYPKALEHYLQAYELRNQQNVSGTAVNEASNIASIYAKMEMKTEALKYANFSVSLAEKTGDLALLSFQLCGVGDVYVTLNNVDTALYYYDKSYQLALQSERGALQSRVLAAIAHVYNNYRNYYEANNYLLKAKTIGNGVVLLDIYLQLGNNYKSLLDYDSALYYFYETKQLATLRGSKKYLLLAAEGLMNHYQHQHNIDSALYYSKLVNVFSDSIYNEKNAKRFSDLRVQLETLEKENEIQQLKLTQYRSKVRTNLIIVISIITITSIAIAFVLFKISQKKRSQKLEIQLEKSKKKLSTQTLSMIHRNNAFDEIEIELKEVRSRCNGSADPGLQKIQKSINLNKSLDNDWSHFSNYFTELYDNFFEHLEKQNSELSNYELRLCALIKLKLTNKEIATILNIEHKSVKMAKYRLKKKLKVGEEQALGMFISQIG